DAFVGAKADGVAEKSSDRAELTTIGATAPGLHRYDAEGSPAFAVFLQPAVKKLGDQVKLLQIKGVPGNDRILLQRRFEFFPGSIDRGVNIFEFAAGRIFDNARPGFIGFAESHCVGVASASVAA